MYSELENIVWEVTRHVVNAAANFILDSDSVEEINGGSNIDDVAKYPVEVRVDGLVLHGPIDSGAVFSEPPGYNIILHVPDSLRMFSLFRTERRDDAETMFVLYKETFPLLVKCDPSLCEMDTLDKISKILRDNKGWSAPHVAAALGLEICLRHPLMKSILNEQDEELLQTPLFVAIAHDNLASVSIILDQGVIISYDMKDLNGNTMFHLAASQSQQILQLLLERAPISQKQLVNELNAEGYTPLHLACKNKNSELIKMLLDFDVNCYVPSPSQGYAIHCAVESLSVPSIQVLVKQDPRQLELKDSKDGGTPLHWSSGPETTIPLLELGSDPNIANDLGNTPLHDSISRGCLESTISLLCHSAYTNIKGDNGETPLHIASRLCSITLMQALIVFGADVNIKNKDGHTARHLACTSQLSDIDKAVYILHAVGAERCHQSNENICAAGCIFSGYFDGIPPENFPNHAHSNLLHDAMYAFSAQTEVQEKIEEPVDIEGVKLPSNSTSTSSTSGTSIEEYIGGRLLCLDGGGIRGLVLTQMLLVMEQEFGMPVIDLFDWVAGTSTGGILALALASGKTVVETQAIYLRMKDKVFVGGRPYSADVLEEFLRTEFGNEKKMRDIVRPKVMIMTALVDRRPIDLHIFRNYVSPSSMIGETEACIQNPDQFVWETAKITGTAPSYFRLDHDQFIDGGFISNNPTLDALTELHKFSTVLKSQGNYKNMHQIPTVVVSLGTGLQPKTDADVSHLDVTWPSGIIDAITNFSRMTALVNLLRDQATQTEGQVVERSRAWCSSIGVPFFRFSPQMSDFIELDEKDYSKLVNLLWETRCYMIANKDTIIKMKRVLCKNGPHSQ